MSPAARIRRPVTLVVVGAAVVFGVLAGCGDDAPASRASGRVDGEELAQSLGCASCHSTNGDRKQGPTWQGLAGSEVTLIDGTTVTADDEYLARSITDPQAEVVDDFIPIMPDLGVSPADVDALVAYIQELDR